MPHLKERIKEIGTAHILFGTDWPLDEIDHTISTLQKELGADAVSEILKSHVE